LPFAPLPYRLHRTCRVEPGAGLVSFDPLAGYRLLPDLGPEHPDRAVSRELHRDHRSEVPTFGDALVFKDGLLRNGTCSFDLNVLVAG
jgi:hypothetical protein